MVLIRPSRRRQRQAGDGIGKHQGQRVATGERSVSLAKICVKATGEAGSTTHILRLTLFLNSPYSADYDRALPIAPTCGLSGIGILHAAVRQGRQTMGRLITMSHRSQLHGEPYSQSIASGQIRWQSIINQPQQTMPSRLAHADQNSVYWRAAASMSAQTLRFAASASHATT